MKADAEVGSTLIDLVSASINEDAINAELIDTTITLLPPSFQVTGIRQLHNGLALQLPEAPVTFRKDVTPGLPFKRPASIVTSVPGRDHPAAG